MRFDWRKLIFLLGVVTILFLIVYLFYINTKPTELANGSEVKDEAVEVLDVADITDDLIEVDGVLIPILMYHHFADDITNISMVTPDKFTSDMIFLKDQGYETIFLSDLVEYINLGTELPEKPIIITMDDGYESEFEYAYPIAQELDLKMTIFVIGWSVGRDTFIDSEDPILPHFTWEQGNEMVVSGHVQIYSHTFDLHSNAGESYGYHTQVGDGMLPMAGEDEACFCARIEEDLITMNDLILDNLAYENIFLAYPYGFFNEEAENIVSEMGIIGTLSTQVGTRRYRTSEDLICMPRMNVDNTMTQEILLESILNLDEL